MVQRSSLASLSFGALFCAAGPSVALLSVNKYSIPKISQDIAYKNLQDNSEVTWLIRLIPYDPNVHNELSIGNLKKLGPPSVRFTFVGPYQELKGYTVAEAVRRLTGSSPDPDMRVSAIIFHLNRKKVRLFPANARGLLQVVKFLEDDVSDNINNKLITDYVLGKVLDKVWNKNEAASVANWGNRVRGVLQHIGVGVVQNVPWSEITLKI